MERDKDRQKGFIIEKIVGRDISKKHALKALTLAVVCGLLFGGATFFGFGFVKKIGELKEEQALEREAERLREEQESKAAEGEQSETGEEAKDADAAAVAENAAAKAEEAVIKKAEEDAAEKAEIRALVQQELSGYTHSREDYSDLLQYTRSAAEKADRYVVSVHAVTTNTTWFEDTVETSETFAGIIISDADPEILILTTAKAVKSGEELSVTFQDGTVAAAVLKQSALLDGLSVIAVSKEGLGTEFLSKLEKIGYGNSGSTKTGDVIMTIGAPLGKIHSYDIGIIGYMGAQETGEDGQMETYYAGISANPELGTFVTNMESELIGVAVPAVGEAKGCGTRIYSIAELRPVLDRLCKGETIPYLGIVGKDISFDMKYENIPQGMYVMETAAGSPAAEAGIKRGDIITGMGDAAINDVSDYETSLRKLSTGDRVSVAIKRSSANMEYKEMRFDVTVGAR